MNDSLSVEWAAFEFTHVRYPKGDLVGHALALISLSPFVVLSAYFTLILYNRDIQILLITVGQLLNESSNILLKRYFKEKRPSHEIPSLTQHPKSFGMPSQHSQFMAFYVTYMCLHLLMNSNHRSSLFRICNQLLLLSVLSGVVFSRVYLIYHTWQQCAVGVFLGCAIGFSWFYILNTLLGNRFFEKAVSWKLSKVFELQFYQTNKNRKTS